MDRINSSGQGEITFWEFIAAFKPPKPGAPPSGAQTADMDKLRLLLATVEHETLRAAFARDQAEDGLSDAEEPAVAMYATRAEGKVRAAHAAMGDAGAGARWYERMAKGGSSVAPGAAAAGPSRAAVAARAKAAAARARERALAQESHLSLMTRISLHRRRFLLTSIMQEKERHISKGSDLLQSLQAAEATGDHEAARVLHASLNALHQRHTKRIDRLGATAVVVEKEREIARKTAAGELSDSDDDAAGGEGEEEGDGDAQAREEGEGGAGQEAGAAEGGEGADAPDGAAAAAPTPLAIEIGLTAQRLPCLNELIKNCHRVIAAAEAAAQVDSKEKKTTDAESAESSSNIRDEDLL
jgi:hypothetical protein